MGQLQSLRVGDAAYDLDDRGSHQGNDLGPEAGSAPIVRLGHDAQGERLAETAVRQQPHVAYETSGFGKPDQCM